MMHFLLCAKVFNTTLQSGAESISSKGHILELNDDTNWFNQAIHTQKAI